ncbi:MAG: tyrosine-type recombinase/integrase [Desulfobulbaceae bacterium]|nr:tyrosine-type recombinase/integrase [Desulfobulbaceae bacterium]
MILPPSINSLKLLYKQEKTMSNECCSKEGNKLDEAIHDYLQWMSDKGYALKTRILYKRVLGYFSSFTGRNDIPWNSTFTTLTLQAFQNEVQLTHLSSPVKGLARYLFRQKRIAQPLQELQRQLTGAYEEYLSYYSKTRQVHHQHIQRIRRVLTAWHGWLASQEIDLIAVGIEDVDGFLAEYNPRFSPQTRQNNRSALRGFLRHLYQNRKISRDLAPLVFGAPLYAQAKPPRFLRPEDVQKLFESFQPTKTKELRTYAMLYLAYFLGLRPKEISLISLDDIFFSRCEINLPIRKSKNPIKLPLPDDAIKAIAAYIIGARPKSDRRHLFLKIRVPYDPVSPALVSHDISNWMHRVNLCSSAYWLRHTYAQNLLEANAGIFEVKQMLGHDKIQTTRNYIHIHTSMMREVLFNETL